MSVKRVLLAAVGLAALVVLSSCARAVHAYFTGTGMIMYSGYPGRTGWNLDPGTRIPLRSRGCRVPYFEPLLVHLPNNLTLDLLAGTLGPMPGTYHGPYPTTEQAAAALRDAPVVLEQLYGNEWPAGIDCEGVRARLAAEGAQAAASGGFAAMRCAVYQGETLLLGNAREAWLFDRGTGQRYALYFLPLPEALQLEGAWSGSEQVRTPSGEARRPLQVTFKAGGGTYAFHGEAPTPLIGFRSHDNDVEFDASSRGVVQHYAGSWNGREIVGSVGKRRFTLSPAL